jgi:hypothetical protein
VEETGEIQAWQGKKQVVASNALLTGCCRRRRA